MNIKLTPASQISPDPTDWLWASRIARRTLTVIEGMPGCNKSSLCFSLLARLSKGQTMPGEIPGRTATRGPANSILLIGEDSDGRVRIELEEEGADLDRIQLASCEAGLIRLPDHVAALRESVIGVAAAMLVIDPLGRFTGDLSRESAARLVTTPLEELARDTGAAVVLVRHLAKAPGADPLYRGMGSIGIFGAARSVLRVAKHPREPDIRVVTQTKNNLGPPAEPLCFRTRQTERQSLVLEFPDPPSAAGGKDQKLRGAMGFLSEYLRDGPVAAGDVRKAAAEREISPRTLTRARQQLHVSSERQGFGPGSRWVWKLTTTARSAPA